MADQLVISRLFKAPRARLWAAWTEPELLARWFGPKGVTTTIVSADIRPGGHVHCHMDFPDGPRIWAKLVYREVEPLIRLEWEHSFSDPGGDIAGSPFGGAWPKRLLNSVTFEDAGADTRIRLTSTPLNAAVEEEAAFRDALDSMHGGWGGNFDVLDAFLAGPA
ncbi:SRPBCC family protein [Rhizorhabdus dicambivorans]|nr:SRPBCC domain-containing protein [Rhizorhabdus dicambivorans]